MTTLGSLYDFIEPLKLSARHKIRVQKQAQGHTNINNQRVVRVRRIKTTLDDYRPSDKREYLKNLVKTEAKEQDICNPHVLLQKYKQKKFFINNNITIPSKKSYIFQLQCKNKQKMNNSLMRALQKVQRDDMSENNSQSQLEQTFCNIKQNLTQLRMTPLLSLSKIKTETEERKIETSSFRIKDMKHKRSLSDSKRIEYEQCLAWAKKHHKVGKHYQKQLGKQKVPNFWSIQVKKRKNMLSILSQRYQKSLSFHQLSS